MITITNHIGGMFPDKTEGNKYLCRVKDTIFVSPIHWSLENGPFVDCVAQKQIYLTNELDEMYLIKVTT